MGEEDGDEGGSHSKEEVKHIISSALADVLGEARPALLRSRAMISKLPPRLE